MEFAYRFYYKTTKHYLFVLDFIVQKEEENDSRVSVVFFKCEHDYVYKRSSGEGLINAESELLVLKSQENVEKLSYQDLKSYVEDTKLKRFKRVEANFEKFFDFSQPLDILPFYYQEFKDKSINDSR